jgi:hypothetical protein
MSKLERFSSGAEAVLITAAVGSMDLLQKRFEDAAKPESPMLLIALELFLLLLIVPIAQALVDLLLDRSQWLRRLVMGKSFIEGKWKDAVYTRDSSGHLTGGILNIALVDGKYRVEGETFNEVGERIGAFISSISELDEDANKLEYVFLKIMDKADQYSFGGTSEYSFITANQPRKTFEGLYRKNGDLTAYRLRGELLTRDERKQSQTAEGRIKIVVDYIKQVQNAQQAR